MSIADGARHLLWLSLCLLALPLGAWWLVRDLAAPTLQAIAPVALAVAALGVALMIVIVAGPLAAGRDRERMGRIFGPWVRMVLVLLALSLLLQGAVVVWALVESRRQGQSAAPIWLMAAVLGTSMYCGWVIVRAALGVFRAEPRPVMGVVLERARHPALFALVDAVAQRLGTAAPDHVVTGLEPTFYVTGHAVGLPLQGRTLHGRSLYVSLALMRVLDDRQLAAVIGHELGHFRGQDEAYSLRFAPVYHRFSSTMEQLSKPSGYWIVDLLMGAPRRVVDTCLMQFMQAERAVSRERELVADRAACEATDAATVARALVAVSLYVPAWIATEQGMVELLRQGIGHENLVDAFEDTCRQAGEPGHWAAAQEGLDGSVQAHPVDTHPPLRQRLQALGTSLGAMTLEEVVRQGPPAAARLTDAAALERDLTGLHLRWICQQAGIDPATITRQLARRDPPIGGPGTDPAAAPPTDGVPARTGGAGHAGIP